MPLSPTAHPYPYHLTSPQSLFLSEYFEAFFNHHQYHKNNSLYPWNFLLSINFSPGLGMKNILPTCLINELINLTHDTSNGLVKVKEKTGMRKDRYSSCLYGWALIQELSKQLKPKSSTEDLLSKLTSQIRPSSLIKKD